MWTKEQLPSNLKTHKVGTITMSYSDCVKFFGEPINVDLDKPSNYWAFKSKDGKVFEIYDYYTNGKSYNIYEWHVGGTGPESVMHLKMFVMDKMTEDVKTKFKEKK